MSTIKYRNGILNIIGIILGLVIYVLWLININIILYYLYSFKYVVNNIDIIKILPKYLSIIQWLHAGLLIHFILLGHYIMTKKKQDICIARILFFCFVFWLAVLFILNLNNIKIDFQINILAGYLIYIFSLFYIRNKNLGMIS